MKKLLILLPTLLVYISLFSQERTQVLIKTDLGEIVVELYDETPKHRENFIKLVTNKYYDGTLFHRVIPDFMIQGGDPNSRRDLSGVLGNGGPGYTIPAEIINSFFHKKGALAAARQPDAVNPKKASSGSQFYIVEGRVFDEKTLLSFEKRKGIPFTREAKKAYTTMGGAPHLDGEYTVFGEVVFGLDVIEKISKEKRDSKNRPIKDVDMTVRIIKR